MLSIPALNPLMEVDETISDSFFDTNLEEDQILLDTGNWDDEEDDDE